MSASRKTLREAFGQFGTGVAIVAIENSAGQPIGLTINSFASVSLQPPLLSWCLANESQLFEEISAAEQFTVNVLAADQVDLSNRMSRPGDHVFAEGEWHCGDEGGVYINGALAHFDCRVHQKIEAGDHIMLIGEIVDAVASDENRPPLLYFRGSYADLADGTAGE